VAEQLVLDRLQTNLTRLRLPRVAQVLLDVVQAAQAQGHSHLQVLDALLEEEVACKEQRRLDTTLRMSGLPFIKTLDDFDYTFQPHLDRRQVNSLFDLTFLTKSAICRSPARNATSSTGSSPPATRRAARSSRPTRRSATGRSCSTIPLSSPPSWTDCCTTVWSSTSRATATD